MYVENIHSNSWLNHIGHSIFHQWFSSINHLMGMCKKENRYHTVQSMVAANQCCRESGALIWRACIILSYYDKSRVKTGHSCSGVIRHKWNISRIHNPCQKKGQTPNMKWKECLSKLQCISYGILSIARVKFYTIIPFIMNYPE